MGEIEAMINNNENNNNNNNIDDIKNSKAEFKAMLKNKNEEVEHNESELTEIELNHVDNIEHRYFDTKEIDQQLQTEYKTKERWDQLLDDNYSKEELDSKFF